ncbi:MAG: response regulator transcription factor [Betaproteobacteria bacterium]|nr:response regulator transcription factor [Betaproteobacteria bacterium]
MEKHPGTVFIVDDDDAIRDSLKWLFQSRGYRVETHPSAEAFLGAYRGDTSGCLVLDVRMPGMSGLELYDILKERGVGLPVVFLSGHGDIPMAVSSLRKGAMDFIEKPFNDNELVDRVAESLRMDEERRRDEASRHAVAERLAQLTPRELEVMQLILAGKHNKVIADELRISMRTVEVHRSRILQKMGVRSAVELAQVVSVSDLPPAGPAPMEGPGH